ncbi:unnamed protein product, partial [Notodromas monacha]
RCSFPCHLQIWRINSEHNVIYVEGCAVPGPTNGYVLIHDSILNHRRLGSETNKDKSALETPPPFPTFYPDDQEEKGKESFAKGLHSFSEPTINFAQN